MRIVKEIYEGRDVYRHYGDNQALETDTFPINFNESYFEDRRKIHIIEKDMYWDELDHEYFEALERKVNWSVHIRYQKIGVVFRIIDEFGSIKERVPFTLNLPLNAGYDRKGRAFKIANSHDPHLHLKIPSVEVKNILGIKK